MASIAPPPMSLAVLTRPLHTALALLDRHRAALRELGAALRLRLRIARRATNPCELLRHQLDLLPLAARELAEPQHPRRLR